MIAIIIAAEDVRQAQKVMEYACRCLENRIIALVARFSGGGEGLALLANAPPPLLLWSARGAPSSPLGPRGSGAPKDARGLRDPSERLAKPPGTLARRAPSALRSAKGRLSALHLRHFPAPGRALPANRSIGSGPPSASSWQGAVVPPGGAPAPPECGVTSPARRRRTHPAHHDVS